MADIQNTFSWSHSRHGTFEDCRRMYWLTYYGSWEGWNPKAKPAIREAYIQKKLTSLPMWTGTLVHDAAERALKGLMDGDPQNAETLVRSTRYRIRQDIGQSRSKAWREIPSRFTAFQEHYYDEPLPDEIWAETADEVERQIRRLLEEPVYKRLIEVPQKLVEVESLEQIPVDGVPVWVKLDALVADGRGNLVVIDWKTGLRHDPATIAAQLGVYGLYCVDRHEVPPDRILTMYVNLRTGEQARHPCSPAVVEEARRAIRESAARMRALLTDVPGNEAREEDFPPLPDDAAQCRFCRFRRSCGREGRPASVTR